jgi:methylenetetrahydrofolate dehydrogenase (NADP+)/methenyltetrahydrofolate cyclohydrolase
MVILDGKKLSEELLIKMKKKLLESKQKMRLDVILVGNDHSSEVFVRRKGMACSFVGIDFTLHRFPDNIGIIEFEKAIYDISCNPDVSGVVIQLPLPKTINKQEVFDLIPSNKDVDILSTQNLGKFYTGNMLYMPPVVGAVNHFFEKYKISLKKKDIVLVGAGRLVGFPLSSWFFRKKATVSIVNEFTEDTFFYTKKADIIISGVGKAQLIKGNMVKKGVIAVDVGVSLVDKKLYGDFDFTTVSKKAKSITPVPGGVGPMTIVCLLENLINLNKKS